MATDNLSLGSPRGSNELSLFSPVLSRTQKRSQNKWNKQSRQSDNNNSGYTSDGSDATEKLFTSLTNRFSVNFFVPPAEHDAYVKLFTEAKKLDG